MQPANYINRLPDELVLFISDDLENTTEVVSLATTCKHILGIFTKVQENAFFKLCTPSLSLNSLYPKIFHLKSKNFVSLPCTSITICGFKKTVETLCAFFPNSNSPIIEGSLRRPIATDMNKQAMTALSAEYLDITAANPKVEEIKRTLHIELCASRDAIAKRLPELWGPNGNDGKIQQAYLAIEDARIMYSSHISFEIALKQLENNPELITLRDNYKYAIATYTNLYNEQKILAIWTGNNITGGKLYGVLRDLADLDGAARRPATQIGDFFAELCQDVSPDQLIECSERLNAIINR